MDSLRIEAGERVAIIGPSGAGKSTLLRCLKGFVTPDKGTVEIFGAPANSGAHERIALIYQQFRLVSQLTTLQNALCGRLGRTHRWRSLLGMFSEVDLRIAWAAINEVGLRDKVHQRADTLSGGEQQRVAVARAVAQEPDVILADEPVSSLDPAWAEDVLELLTNVQAHHQATLLMTLHQPELARRFAQRVIGLRGGRIVWDLPPRDVTERALDDLYEGLRIHGTN